MAFERRALGGCAGSGVGCRHGGHPVSRYGPWRTSSRPGARHRTAAPRAIRHVYATNCRAVAFRPRVGGQRPERAAQGLGQMRGVAHGQGRHAIGATRLAASSRANDAGGDRIAGHSRGLAHPRGPVRVGAHRRAAQSQDSCKFRLGRGRTSGRHDGLTDETVGGCKEPHPASGQPPMFLPRSVLTPPEAAGLAHVALDTLRAVRQRRAWHPSARSAGRLGRLRAPARAPPRAPELGRAPHAGRAPPSHHGRRRPPSAARRSARRAVAPVGDRWWRGRPSSGRWAVRRTRPSNVGAPAVAEARGNASLGNRAPCPCGCHGLGRPRAKPPKCATSDLRRWRPHPREARNGTPGPQGHTGGDWRGGPEDRGTRDGGAVPGR